jgi:dTDP-4-dehydrorhamnose reductase
MKIILLGSSGQLGKELKKEFKKNIIFLGTSKNINFLNIKKDIKKINKLKFDILVNAAAYTDVNKAETNKLIATKINSYSLKYISKVCNKKKAKLIHFSTDYVYSGKKNILYNETVKSKPINYYGKTKALGEHYIKKYSSNFLIFRVSYLISKNNKNNLISKIINNIKKNKKIDIVIDQFYVPTSVKFIADNLHKIIQHPNFMKTNGIFNLSPEAKNLNLLIYLKKLFKIYKLKENFILNKISLKEFTIKYAQSNKPRYSIMNCTKIKKIFNLRLINWKKDLKNVL